MKQKRFLMAWALIALLGLAVGLGTAAASDQTSNGAPALNYLRVDRDHLARWVIHWAAEGLDPAAGDFALVGYPARIVCPDILAGSPCQCAHDFDGPGSIWAGCYFEDPRAFSWYQPGPEGDGLCLAWLFYVEAGRWQALRWISWACPDYVYIPVVSHGS